MKRLAFLVCCVFFLGCEGADYVSQSGVRIVYRDTGVQWQPEHIDKQELYFLQKLNEAGLYPDAIKALRMAIAYIYSDKIPCTSSPTGYCNGFQDYTNVYIRSMGCPYNSAYTHELGHLIQQYAGINDYNHEEKSFWDIADSAPEACP
ncbi:MAG: hypothetical protein EBZ49_15605 [Proteobacteria bacterium]|nr:hypothetical protein [Pseudomonadota bacterium]